MPTATSMIPAVSLGDPQFTANVHDGIARITELINSELSQADEVMRDTVAHLVDAGGTPFRPLFTVLAAQLGSDPDGWEVTVAGAVIELMHLGTLCHDRVVDESDMSRKTPSDNTRWTNNFAILAGDYRFATASQLASRLDPEAFAVVAEAFAELITGQMRATRGPASHIDTIEHYLRVVHEKTGSLIAASGQLGAALSGAAEEQIRRVARLGRMIGAAFEISRDIIAISGDSATLSGADLGQAVHTLPMLYALREQTPDTSRLRELLAGPIHDDHVAEALTLLRCSPGIGKAKNVVAAYAAQAREELPYLPDRQPRRALATLIDHAVSACD